MRNMNILNEIDDFKRLTGLLTESGGGLIAKLKRVPWIDDLLTDAVVASDSEVGKIAKKIDSNGIRSLTDDELLYLLTKLPADEVANKLIKGNVLFTEAQVETNLRKFLGDITQGSKTWDEITEALTNEKSLRTLWGQSLSPMTDDVYDGLEDILNEVGQKYLDDIEDFIRKNGSDSAKAKLPSQIPKKIRDAIGRTLRNNNTLSWINSAFRGLRRNQEKIIADRDALFDTIAKKVKEGNGTANIDLEIRKLAELATAAKTSNKDSAVQIMKRWFRDAGVDPRITNDYIRDNNWYKTWSELVEEQRDLDSIGSYLNAWKKTLPKIDGKWNPEFIQRWINLLVLNSPYTRKELLARMGAKGVRKTLARRYVSSFIALGVFWPFLKGLYKWLKNYGDDRNKTVADYSLDEIKSSDKVKSFGILPESWTALDEAWSLLFTGTEDFSTIFGPEKVNRDKAIAILEGTYEGEDSVNAKTHGVRDFIESKYSDIPNRFLLKVKVDNNNKVFFRQTSSDNITNVPLALINGEIYLINRQSNKKLRFDKLWSGLNEGLINILNEQEIDWGGGEPIDDSIDLDTIDDITTTDWVEVIGLGGDEDGDSSGSEEDGDSGIDLSFLGGTGSSGPGWEFNRNPTGQLKSDRDAARLDADSYTKGNIYVYEKPDGTEELVLAGKLAGGTPHLFKVEKNESGKWGWINDSQDPPMWEDFKDY